MRKLKSWPLYFVIFIVLFLCGTFYLLNGDTAKGYQVVKGKLNLEDWDQSEGLLDLTGEWEFYWKEHILDPTPETEKHYIQVPSSWDDVEQYTPNGYATYRMIIENLNTNELYGLNIQSIKSAYNLYIDGDLLASSGIPGNSKENTESFASNKTTFFPVNNDKLEIIFQVSNFDYRYGGIANAISFGTATQLHEEARTGLGFEMILFGCLIISGIYHFIVFIYRRQNKSAMYFSIVCFLIGLRMLVTDHFFIHGIFPEIPWEVMVKIEYITFYLAVPMFYWMLSALFPTYLKEIYGKIFTVVTVIFSLVVLVSPISIASHTINPFQTIIILLIPYIMISLLVALKDKQEGSLIITLLTAVVALTAIHDILLSNKLIDSVPLSSLGLVMFILSQSYIIALHSGKAFQAMEEATSKLAELNLTLEERVRERTKSLEKSRDHLNKLNEKLEYLSYNDQLTKTFNRRYFEEKFEEEWKLAIDKKFKVGVVYIDIDYFKQFNDKYGHEAGDCCLIQVATALKKVLTPYNGYVARIGGEEFIAVLSDTNDLQLKSISEQCLVTIKKLQIPHEASPISNVLTISIGAALAQPNNNSSTKELIIEADSRLYKAKGNGRNQIAM